MAQARRRMPSLRAAAAASAAFGLLAVAAPGPARAAEAPAAGHAAAAAPAHGAAAAAADAAPAPWFEEAKAARAATRAQLGEYGQLGAGAYQLPIDRTLDLVVANPALLAPVAITMDLGPGASLADRGRLIFNSLQPCSTCHSVDGTVKIGPSLKGRFGGTAQFTDGTTVPFDEAYVRESILTPSARVSNGFPPVMPPFVLSEEDLTALVEFVKSLR